MIGTSVVKELQVSHANHWTGFCMIGTSVMKELQVSHTRALDIKSPCPQNWGWKIHSAAPDCLSKG